MRRFRFGLRTILAIVAVAAVACWVYMVGWPTWQLRNVAKRFQKVESLAIEPGDSYSMTAYPLPNGGRVMTITGGCSFRIDEIQVRADNAIAWIPRTSRWPIRLYLEGNVCVNGQGPGGKYDAVYLNSNKVEIAFVARGKLNQNQISLAERASDLRRKVDAGQALLEAEFMNTSLEPLGQTKDASEPKRPALPKPPVAVN